MAPGARSKFGTPMSVTGLSEANVAYCIEKSTSDIVGTFRRPPSDLPPGELCPLIMPLISRNSTHPQFRKQ